MEMINGIQQQLLAIQVYNNAKDKGFFDNDQLSRNHHIMLVIGELGEAIDAHRKNRRADVEAYHHHCHRLKREYKEYNYDASGLKEDLKTQFERYIKDTLEDELADAYIRLLCIWGAYFGDINLDNYLESTKDTEGHMVFSKYITDSSKEFRFTEDMHAITTVLCMDEIYSLRERIVLSLSLIQQVANKYSINLEYHVGQKIIYNEQREHLHGNLY